MMRKKHLIQTNEVNKTKVMENPRAKVTVQYIREQQLIQKTPNTLNAQHIMHHDETSPQDELEIETVEYLEDHQNVEEYIEDRSDKDEFEDNFYPNAIHCLLDLYKTKYDKLNTTGEEPVAANKVTQIWRDIAKVMQESLFEFQEREIQHKYVLLREQYFAVETKEDIENFDYFEQLHDIYKDPEKENIIKGLNSMPNNRIYYKDEFLMHPDQLEVIDEEHDLHNFKSEEIVHKEHEFIDMVEKELQAMEGGEPRVHVKEVNSEEKEIMNSKTKEESLSSQVQPEHYKNLKRTIRERESTEEPLGRKPKTDVLQESSNPSINLTINDFTLYHYNEHQERRHREKISLMEKSLQIQERALQQQHLLIQELIKRLPS
ncbi:uncharacterized protein ACRADG_009267 isoform 2-T2 [Cochliomyia hominivorax]